MTRVRTILLVCAALALLGTVLPSATAAPTPSPDEDGCIRPVIRTAAPVGTTGCPGVRPGAFLIVPSANAGCTMGFLYSDAKRRYYMTTAGHCVVADGVQKTWHEGTGPVVTDSNGRPIGRFVFASLKGEYDIGVILVLKGVSVKASVCHFGGPTSLTKSKTDDVVILEHYGNATLLGELLPARTGVTSGMPDTYWVATLMPSSFGDSGGPVLTASGKAVGFVIALGFGAYTGVPAHAGVVIVARLGPQMSLAQKALKRTLKLRTAPHSPSTF